jgi:hypothetical protein
MGYSETLPFVVMRPMLLPCCSLNQKSPSGPLVMPPGAELAVGSRNSVKLPDTVTRPTLPAPLGCPSNLGQTLVVGW